VVVEFLPMVLVKTSVCDRIGGSTVVTFNEGRGAETTLEDVADAVGVRLVMAVVYSEFSASYASRSVVVEEVALTVGTAGLVDTEKSGVAVHLTSFMVVPFAETVISLQPWERVGFAGMDVGTEVWIVTPTLLSADGVRVGSTGAGTEVWMGTPTLLPAGAETVMISVTLRKVSVCLTCISYS
jgi:hypothetical protein